MMVREMLIAKTALAAWKTIEKIIFRKIKKRLDKQIRKVI